MADNNITIQFTVQDAQAFKAWQRQQAAAAKMKKELDALKKSGSAFGTQLRSALADVNKGITNTTNSLRGQVLGWLAVGNAVSAISTQLDQLEEKGRSLGITFDEAFRKFNIQANLKGLKAKEAQKNIEDVAVKMAMDPIEVAGISEQLVSSGFNAEQASGPALLSTLKMMAGTNQAMGARGEGAVSNKEIIQAVSSYLENQGLDKTAASIDRFAVVAQSAFKATNLQLEDFKDLAGESSNFRGVLSMEEQVAMMAEIRDTNPSGQESATGMRNIVLRTSAITEPTRLEALKKTGLRDDEINGIGKDYIGGLMKLREGLKKLPEAEQNKVLKVMFEERGVSFAKTLMQPGRLERIKERAATGFTDRKQYEEDVVTATSGKAAQSRRLKTEEEIRLGNKAQDTVSFQEASTAARTIAVEQHGMSETEAALRQTLAWTLSKVGMVTPNVGGETDEQKTQRITAQAFSIFSPHLGSFSGAQKFQGEVEAKLKSTETPNAVPIGKPPVQKGEVQQRPALPQKGPESGLAPIGNQPQVRQPVAPTGQELDNAHTAVSSASDYVAEASSDGILNRAETNSAGFMVQRATAAVEAAKGTVSKEDFDSLKEKLERVVAALDRNTNGTDKNTKAAENSVAVKPPSPQFSQGGPSPRKQIVLPSPNNQASRGLDVKSPLIAGGR